MKVLDKWHGLSWPSRREGYLWLGLAVYVHSKPYRHVRFRWNRNRTNRQLWINLGGSILSFTVHPFHAPWRIGEPSEEPHE